MCEHRFYVRVPLEADHLQIPHTERFRRSSGSPLRLWFVIAHHDPHGKLVFAIPPAEHHVVSAGAAMLDDKADSRAHRGPCRSRQSGEGELATLREFGPTFGCWLGPRRGKRDRVPFQDPAFTPDEALKPDRTRSIGIHGINLRMCRRVAQRLGRGLRTSIESPTRMVMRSSPNTTRPAYAV